MTILATPLETADFLRIGAAAFLAFMVVATLLSVIPNHIRRWHCARRGKVIPEDIFEKRSQMAGGYAVLLFAVVINQGFVNTAAVFIAGRLIAPEQFLLLLASILRGGKHAASIAAGIMAMNRDEKNKKINDEIEDDSDDDDSKDGPSGGGPGESPAPAPPSARPGRQSHRVTANEVMLLEKKLFTMIESKVNSDHYFLPYAKVKTDKRLNSYDGLIIDRSTDKVKIAFEAKYRTRVSPTNIRQTLKLLEPILTNEFRVVILFVLATSDKRHLETLYSVGDDFKATHPNAGLAYYTYVSGKLDVLNDDDVNSSLRESGVTIS